MLNKKCPHSGMPASDQYTLGVGPLKIGFCSKKHRDLTLWGAVAALAFLSFVLL